MRIDQTREIIWNLRPLGELRSTLSNDGNGLIYHVWLQGGQDADGKAIVGQGQTMDEAIQALWALLTATGACVMINNRKHVFGRGVWQQVLE